MLVGLSGLLVVQMSMPRVSSTAVVVLGPPPISGRASAFEPLGAGAAGRTPSVNTLGLSSISETAPHTTSLLWTSVSSTVVWVSLHPPCGFTAACAVNHPHRCHRAVPHVIVSVPVHTVVRPSPPPTSRNFPLPQQKLCPHETPASTPSQPLAPTLLLSVSMTLMSAGTSRSGSYSIYPFISCLFGVSSNLIHIVIRQNDLLF